MQHYELVSSLFSFLISADGTDCILFSIAQIWYFILIVINVITTHIKRRWTSSPRLLCEQCCQRAGGCNSHGFIENKEKIIKRVRRNSHVSLLYSFLYFHSPFAFCREREEKVSE